MCGRHKANFLGKVLKTSFSIMKSMELDITKDTLDIRLDFWEKVWSFHGNFSIPLEQVVKAKYTKVPRGFWQLRLPGTHLPSVFKAGTYYTQGNKEFWYIHGWKKEYLYLELEGHSYEVIVLDIENGNTLAADLNNIFKTRK